MQPNILYREHTSGICSEPDFLKIHHHFKMQIDPLHQ